MMRVLETTADADPAQAQTVYWFTVDDGRGRRRTDRFGHAAAAAKLARGEPATDADIAAWTEAGTAEA